jgi:tetratricopeptide (TPR) repeat protein
MPAKDYMVVDPRRDHSLRIPRPDLSVKLGTPNACTGCHTDQTARWAADAVATWYGPERRQEPHYGEVIAAGRAGDASAESRLIALAGNEQQPVIVRATALELLQGYGSEALRALAVATRDPEPLLRATAIRGLERLPPEQRLALVAPLLTDPIRGVRTEAARVLASVPAEQLADGAQRQAFAAALAEYREAQLATADMPAGRLNLGVLHIHEGEQEQAVNAYRTAIDMDPYFLPARVNLANLYNAMGRNPDAERELREAIARAPEQGELHYSLGLLLAEDGRLAESADALGEAAKRLPKRQRVHYNYALALQKLGRLGEAETAYLTAERLDRNNPDVLQALVAFYLQQRKWDQAYGYVERLVRLYPDAPEPLQLLRQLQVLKQYGAAPQ